MRKTKLSATLLALAAIALTSCGSVEQISSTDYDSVEEIVVSSNEEDEEEVEEDIEGYFEQPSVYRDIEKCIEEGSVLDNYGGGKGYALLKHALNKQAHADYSLTIGTATVSVLSGLYKQTVKSATFNTPDTAYNENISSSVFVKTANKFYDYGDGNITAYLASTASEWTEDLEPSSYDYDSFIQEHGKIHRGRYFCTDCEETINDKFMSFEQEDFINSSDSSKHEVNSVIIYILDSEYISGVSTASNDETGGYTVTLTLASEAMSYYAVQMKNTGGLDDLPSFSPSTIQFELSTDLYPVSSVFNDSYTMSMSILSNVSATQVMYQYYYHGNTNVFDGVTVTVPELTETEFSGYELLPED